MKRVYTSLYRPRGTSLCGIERVFGASPTVIVGTGWDWSFYLLTFSSFVFCTALVGLLLEDRVAIRVVLLFEVCLASIVGCALSFSLSVGVLASVLALVFLVIAAVETIILFGFIVLIHHLDQISDIARLQHLQS